MKLSSVTRIEVIDENGRKYTNYNAQKVELQLQDDERTLKVFVSSAQIESLDPDNAPSDGPNMLRLEDFEGVVDDIHRYSYTR